MFETITLIDALPQSVYCGSIPDSVAKQSKHDYADWTIDLNELCLVNNHYNNVRFVQGYVRAIEFDRNLIYLEQTSDPGSDGPIKVASIAYDIVSIDIGSKSKSIRDVPGAVDHVIPTRPMQNMLQRLTEAEKEFSTTATTTGFDCSESCNEKEQPPINVAVVGGGAAGIELALSIVGRWKPLLGRRSLRVSLITTEKILLPEIPSARSRLKDILVQKGIVVFFQSLVTYVERNSLHLESGMTIPFSYCLWATGPGPNELVQGLRKNGLGVTDEGWVKISSTLQSCSYPNVFASGDCAYLVANPLPKAGVYALQQGPLLAENINKYARSQPLVPFEPNKDDLQFLGCGDGTAVGFAFGMVLRGEWVFEVKQAMDRRRFETLAGTGTRKRKGLDRNSDSTRRSQDGRYGTPRSAGDHGSILEVVKQVESISPASAAKLLKQIDVRNYNDAWAILEIMSVDKTYRVRVMREYNRLSQAKERGSKRDRLAPSSPFQFLSWLFPT